MNALLQTMLPKKMMIQALMSLTHRLSTALQSKHRSLNGRRAGWGLAMAGALLLTSCQAVSNGLPLGLPGQSASVGQTITIESVQPASQLGTYMVSGQANFPKGTDISVSALRRVRPETAADTEGFEALLDRQMVKVDERRWSVQLQLLQTEPGGGERWQAEAAYSPQPWVADPDVVFMATLDPSRQTPALRKQLDKNESGFESGQVRISEDGELYAIATTTATIPPPEWEAVPGALNNAVESRQAGPPRSTSTLPPNPKAPQISPDAYLR
ncbi:MAG: hypothetical protein AAFY78_18750 [Cyanobacteria bacterium J06648_16]